MTVETHERLASLENVISQLMSKVEKLGGEPEEESMAARFLQKQKKKGGKKKKGSTAKKLKNLTKALKNNKKVRTVLRCGVRLVYALSRHLTVSAVSSPNKLIVRNTNVLKVSS